MKPERHEHASVAFSFKSGRSLNVVVPRVCSSCGMGNYNIWGTLMGGRLRVEIRCMRCGKVNGSLENVIYPEI